MELVKPVLLFLAGVVSAAAFYLFGLDHQLPHWMHLSRDGDAIHLAIAPSGGTGRGDCPPGYAIDNRTDRPVFLAMESAEAAYPSTPGPERDNVGYDGDRSYPRSAAYESTDVTGLGVLSSPESAEPGINAPDDSDPGTSNYGGSSVEFGDADTGRDRQARADDRFGSPDDEYDNRHEDAVHDETQPSRDRDEGYDAAPAPGQPIPLTPPDSQPSNAAPESPPAPPNGSGRFGATTDSPFGHDATRVRPGEIFFASTENSFEGCRGSGNTVTLRLSD